MTTLLITLLVATLAGISAIYYYSLKDEPREHQKTRVDVPTDYDGMGTFSRYINK
ncbi:MAG: hypothetical protein LAT75_03215 [Candidatus Cyclonatronum sp.]|uniref:hypothetical protein n=1 Tax=Cyclonatronum sp. TaxID=3024185 RepID=UPI0025BBE00E|nr:hypothetical protein [Cyclonatronum sp.]MCC5934346.1 hypothetical protein [Balneolales bacterium]MCH8485846.1 hypothetical protein [Cyclonatronum sp.]